MKRDFVKTMSAAALLATLVSFGVGHSPASADGRGDGAWRESGGRQSRDGDGEREDNTRRLAPNQVHVQGFYRGQRVEYLDLGEVKVAPGNDIDPIWTFTNGSPEQKNIIDTVPGDPAGYTPLWQVVKLTWKSGVRPRTLKSADAINAAIASGALTSETTNTIVNCPVLGFNQPIVKGFIKGQRAKYYDLGPVKLAPGNDIDPIWVVTNGARGQGNIIDNAPPAADYTPLWQVITVTFNEGVQPYLLTSATAVQEAQAAGKVTLTTTDTVVNCPVV